MLQTKSLFLRALPGIIIATFLVVAIIYAWTEPTTSPPAGNVAAPINVGGSSQYKSGALGIGGVFRAYNNAIFDGNVGIGTTAPVAKFDVAGTIKSSTQSNFYQTTIANLQTLHSSCNIITPTGVLMCISACNRYCRNINYSGGTLVEWFNPNAWCACIP